MTFYEDFGVDFCNLLEFFKIIFLLNSVWILIVHIIFCK